LQAHNVEICRPICCTFPELLWPKSYVLKYANRLLKIEMAPLVNERQLPVRWVFSETMQLHSIRFLEYQAVLEPRANTQLNYGICL